jgi:uncharacterized protein YodC (DUF2158 family)
MSDFKPGDQVMLKSSGPVMTVDFVRTESGFTTVTCVWFDNKFEPHQIRFGADSLKAV